ncbi:MAG: hypothetical protein HRU28_08460 [Rhizobiales bacterium]|nr:hypothetical protein [Hyphomicrobiales bacterium]
MFLNNKPLYKIFAGSCFLLIASCASVSAPTNANKQFNPSSNNAIDQQANAFRNVQFWGKAYEADKKSSINIIGYAKALSGIGSQDRAIKILEIGSLEHPKDSAILRTYGNVLAKKGLVGPALRKLQTALKYSPNNWRLYNEIGGLHSKLSEHLLARDSFKRALKISPNNASIHTNMGLSYLLSKNLNLAEHHLSIAVSQPNATSRMRGNYALALGLQGKYKQARKVFLQDMTLAQTEANIFNLKKINGVK